MIGMINNIQIHSQYSICFIIDGRWCDYKIDGIVYDVRSKHQHVMILKTMDFGKLLVLDGFANLAESDTVHYTHSLMNLPEVFLLHSRRHKQSIIFYLLHLFHLLINYFLCAIL